MRMDIRDSSRPRAARIVLCLGIVALTGALAAPAVGAATPKTIRVSVHSNGTESNADSGEPSVSANGRFVAFESDASDLVNNDVNGFRDVFVHDRKTKTTTLVSVRSNGAQGDQESERPAISDDGRYVAFQSHATNLVNGDTNNAEDVFVHDRKTGRTRRVSLRSNGAQGDDDSSLPSISANGRFVAFESDATNLVNNDTNTDEDIFVHDRRTGVTTRVSRRSNGAQANASSHNAALSGNGRYVGFDSEATNLVNGDTNGFQDVFVHDRQTGKTTRVSLRSNGQQANESSEEPALSFDGRYVALESSASNLVPGDSNGVTDLFVRDRAAGVTRRVSIRSNGAQANADSNDVGISASGRFVAFESEATNLVGGDTNATQDIFIHDRSTGRTRRVSVGAGGTQGNGESDDTAISDDGRFVAFDSDASNLVGNDNNALGDIFRRGPLR